MTAFFSLSKKAWRCACLVRIGWGALAVIAVRAVMIVTNGAAWARLLNHLTDVPARVFLVARWIREAVDVLLPVVLSKPAHIDLDHCAMRHRWNEQLVYRVKLRDCSELPVVKRTQRWALPLSAPLNVYQTNRSDSGDDSAKRSPL